MQLDLDNDGRAYLVPMRSAVYRRWGEGRIEGQFVRRWHHITTPCGEIGARSSCAKFYGCGIAGRGSTSSAAFSQVLD